MKIKIISIFFLLATLYCGTSMGVEKVKPNPYKDSQKAFNYVYTLCIKDNKVGGWETYKLGSYYEKGYGTKQDLIKAYVWYKMSAVGKYKPAIIALEKLKKRLNKKECDDAQRQYVKVRDAGVQRELDALKNLNRT